MALACSDVAAVLADPSRRHHVSRADRRAGLDRRGARPGGRDRALTASEHVRALTDAGFVRTLKQGRHRYVRLEGPDVAELIETARPARRARTAAEPACLVRARRLAAARTCYDHLAGRLGVAFRDGMLATGLSTTPTACASPGRPPVLAELGVELTPARAGRVRQGLPRLDRAPRAPRPAPCPPRCSTARSPPAGSSATRTARSGQPRRRSRPRTARRGRTPRPEPRHRTRRPPHG